MPQSIRYFLLLCYKRWHEPVTSKSAPQKINFIHLYYITGCFSIHYLSATLIFMDDQIAQPITPDTKPALIEEPPLINQKSCLRRGCSLLFSCSVLAVIVFLLIGWFWSEPGAPRLAALPNNFPTDI